MVKKGGDEFVAIKVYKSEEKRNIKVTQAIATEVSILR
jgi:hypothetical protein